LRGSWWVNRDLDWTSPIRIYDYLVLGRNRE